ncbi:sensor histidine kinase [Lachnospiraceae bacterium]|nr:sensor histidine kinase [Lachnospiraceae bacterium]
MKDFNWLTVKMILLLLAMVCCLNFMAWKFQERDNGRVYRISCNRVQHEIQKFEKEKNRAVTSLRELLEYTGASDYEQITGICSTGVLSSPREKEKFWENTGEDYIVVATSENYYKITYTSEYQEKKLFLWINGTAGIFLAGMSCMLLFIRFKILKPFRQFCQLPYQLSKGNLTVPLQENRNRFFGRFLWGMDLLREHLEEQKRRELELQKEKKMLLLSLSHDIKTPLSAIKLYARAIGRNLYEEEKKQEIAKYINQKADEIEKYISEIIRASNEDFLDFQVQNQEIYIGRVLREIRLYYQEKMALSQINFHMGDIPECLVYADFDRLVEVIQNVVENAIKYGDGVWIDLTAQRQEEEYLIIIKNSGCQLPSKELSHIFDSFFRGSNVAKQPGSGLGLYICRQLMHRMEGEITASMEQNHIMKVVAALRVV